MKSKVDHLCRQFVQGSELNENELINKLFSYCALLMQSKKYLRELPVPLLLIVDSSSSSITIWKMN